MRPASSQGGVARLALWANGFRLARVEGNRHPPQAFDVTGVFAGSDQPGANVLFDDFSAREIP